MKAWTLVRVIDSKSGLGVTTCGRTGVDFSLIFRTRRDAELYKIGRGLLDAKIKRIEVNLL